MSRAAVVLAAGHGTRLRSARAKVFHEVAGVSMLHRAVASAHAAAPRVVVVAGSPSGPYRDLVEPLGAETVVQEKPRGTGDAVLCAQGLLEGEVDTLIVTCGDVPLLRGSTLTSLADAHEEAGAAATILTVRPDDPSGYGRIVRDDAGTVQAIVEEADADEEQKGIDEVNTGIYAFSAPDLWQALPQVDTDNQQGEVYLTDVVEILRAGGGKVAALLVEDPMEVMGVNTREELARAGAEARQRNLRRLMESGVTVVDPKTTYVDDEVVCGRDVVLHPGVTLQGQTTLAEGVEIGHWSRLRSCRVDEGAIVLDHCVLEEARLERNTTIGPFARMRGGAHIEHEAQIGNFVEVKGSRIGPRTKAKHLAYLGDATVGRDANIGAGTITCNHDGFHKHPTFLGERAYIGSNATLVAPLTVGEGAYVGAASVITEDVPADALALGRCRQTVKEDWAARRRGAPAEDDEGQETATSPAETEG